MKDNAFQPIIKLFRIYCEFNSSFYTDLLNSDFKLSVQFTIL